ncbi:MAG: helix-turn-helix transcriptional regulator [Bacteroidetes bacterium]|nr:helix-turn-helix transcriptional regulator [Balneolaceae bacterium]MDA0736683.1 helix-turn-helix transcriptional regulator [Bacteroidota bacterium]MDA1125401.1 helix-turn-helix transcriptional regulator [Bacteroidota bacterium]
MLNQVKLYRVKLNLTQEALARAVGVSRQAINAIETGKFSPSLETAFRISKLFGVAIEEVFELVDE